MEQNIEEIRTLLAIVEKFEKAAKTEKQREQLNDWRIHENDLDYVEPSEYEAYDKIFKQAKNFSCLDFSAEERRAIIGLLTDDIKETSRVRERFLECRRNHFNELVTGESWKEKQLNDYDRLLSKEKEIIALFEKSIPFVGERSLSPLTVYYRSKFKIPQEQAFITYCAAKKSKCMQQEDMAFEEAKRNPGVPQVPSDMNLTKRR